MSLQQLERRQPINYVDEANFERATDPNKQGLVCVIGGVRLATGVVKVAGMSADDELLVELLPLETRLDELNANVGDVTDVPAATDSGNYSIIALIKRGLQHLTNILAGINSLAVSSAGNISVQTAAVGSDWTAFAAQACERLVVLNTTGTTLEFRQGGAGVGLQIPNSAGFTFEGITNTNQIEVRRVDLSNTQVTTYCRWEA